MTTVKKTDFRTKKKQQSEANAREHEVEVRFYKKTLKEEVEQIIDEIDNREKDEVFSKRSE